MGPGGQLSAFECAWLGIASKLFASTITYPSQVVRSRIQQRNNQGTTAKYNGFFQSFAHIIRHEGVLGRGLHSSTSRLNLSRF